MKNRKVLFQKDIAFLIIIALLMVSINCSSGPEPVEVGLKIVTCPLNYDQNSGDSLEVILKLSPISSTHYVWFKGTCGSDLLISSSVSVAASQDSQSITVKWRPEPLQFIPTACYKITGYMDQTNMDPWPQYETEGYKTINIYRSDGDTIIVIAYSGCQRSARQDDRLSDTVAFKIRARVTNLVGGGINNAPVFFYTNKGVFVGTGGSHTYSTMTGTVHNYLGIAEATLHLTEGSGGTGGENYDYEVTATSGSIYRTFYERCVSDGELSNLPENCTHKRLNVNNPNTEIPGDNLPNGSGEDPNSNIKDVFIEVDYSSALLNIQDNIGEICSYAELALERGRIPGNTNFYSSGIDVHFLIDEAISIATYATKLDIIGKLCEYRDSTKYIHCIVGHYYADDTTLGGASFGYEYRNSFDYEERIFLAGVLSSNEVYGSLHIDSMGCYVAYQKCNDLAAQVGYSGWLKYVGVIMAHEIGHALGLEHIENLAIPESDSSNIMHSPIIVTSDWEFRKWGFFWLNRLYDTGDPDYIFALDLLNKLGVETASMMDHAFDR